jgi:hypothetical protein
MGFLNNKKILWFAFSGKRAKMVTYFVKHVNCPNGEISPNLVTLAIRNEKWRVSVFD